MIFFTVSGATSLVLEVVWTRMLGTVFGNTVMAASTVLTAFMLGLALGSAWFGRLADRSRHPLALYGCLEIGIGLYACLFLWLARACSSFYIWFYHTFEPGILGLTTMRFGLSLALLLPPTLLMGGTLPVLGKYLGQSYAEPGRELGYLYGANTLGGVLGCFLTGFVLLAVLGVNRTLLAAGGLALSTGMVAVLLAFSTTANRGGWLNFCAGIFRTKPDHPGPKGEPLPPASHRQPSHHGAAATSKANFQVVLVCFAITGFCSMAYELLWTRILIFLLTTSAYAFASMLTAFLVGIALGSFLSAHFLVPRIRQPLLWFGLLAMLTGLAALGSVPLLAHLNSIDARLFQSLSWGGLKQLILTYMTDTLVVLLLPTMLMGAIFPVVTSFCLRGEEAFGRRLGQVYAANTVGCVLGSLGAGFGLLPWLGTHHGLLVVVALNLLAGVVLVWRGAKPVWRIRCGVAVPVAALASAAFILTPADIFHRMVSTYYYPSKITYFKEHSTGTVSVHDLPNGERLIAVDGVNVAGLDFMLRATQKRQGYISLCLHPQPKKVVQIGFGSGETARVGLAFGVEQYTVVEICPAIFDASPGFEAINNGSYRDPRLRKVIMDGKNFALLSNEKFDLIMNDSIYPGSSGSSALYTYDHFLHCRERLAPGGLFSCWVPLDLRPREMRMILKSFQAVFPHTSFWIASNCVNKNGLILGSLEPLQIDFARLKERLERPAIRTDLAAIEMHDVYDFLDCFMCDAASIRRMVRDDPLNTDDQPRLEFSCALRPPWELRLQADLAMLTSFRAPVTPSVVNFTDPQKDRDELTRRYEATTHVFKAQVAQLAGLPKVRRNEMDQALQANPGEAHVRSNEAELAREIQDLHRLAADYPGAPIFRLRLADKLYMALRFPEAADLFEQLLNAGKQPANAFVHLAEIRFHFNQIAEAEQILRQCLVLWPDSAEAHDRLGGVCLKSHRLDEAWLHLKEALRLEPGNPLYQAHRDELEKASHK